MPESRKQKTQPKGIDPKTGKPYKSATIPVPVREDVENVLGRAIHPPKKRNKRG